MRFGDLFKRRLGAPSSAAALSLDDRAARFRRGCEVVDSLSGDCLRMLVEDAAVLALAATKTPLKAPPPVEESRPARRPHHGMFIVASEDIRAGQVIYLDAVADGSYNARLRPTA